MKKLALAIAVAAMSSQAMAVSLYSSDDASLSLYGEIRTRIQKENGSTAKFDGNNTRFGLLGNYSLTPSTALIGEFRITGDFNNSENSTSFDRGYVGIADDTYGIFRIGRMPSVADRLISYDQSWVYGGVAKSGTSAFGTDIASSSFQWENTYGAITLYAQGQGEANDSATFTNNQYLENDNLFTSRFTSTIKNGYALGASLATDIGLTMNVAYTTVSLTNKESGTTYLREGEAESFAIGATWAIDNNLDIGVAAFSRKQTANKGGLIASAANNIEGKQQGFGLSGRYSFDGGISVYGVYDYLKDENTYTTLNVPNDKSLETETNQITLGVDYWVHPQLVTFAEVAEKDMTDNRSKSASQDDTTSMFALGARFYF